MRITLECFHVDVEDNWELVVMEEQFSDYSHLSFKCPKCGKEIILNLELDKK
jgi:predicted RNA-binding Zn-ribbon protein involved in translation (DUF1610 family)